MDKHIRSILFRFAFPLWLCLAVIACAPQQSKKPASLVEKGGAVVVWDLEDLSPMPRPPCPTWANCSPAPSSTPCSPQAPYTVGGKRKASARPGGTQPGHKRNRRPGYTAATRTHRRRPLDDLRRIPGRGRNHAPGHAQGRCGHRTGRRRRQERSRRLRRGQVARRGQGGGQGAALEEQGPKTEIQGRKDRRAEIQGLEDRRAEAWAMKIQRKHVDHFASSFSGKTPILGCGMHWLPGCGHPHSASFPRFAWECIPGRFASELCQVMADVKTAPRWVR